MYTTIEFWFQISYWIDFIGFFLKFYFHCNIIQDIKWDLFCDSSWIRIAVQKQISIFFEVIQDFSCIWPSCNKLNKSLYNKGPQDQNLLILEILLSSSVNWSNTFVVKIHLNKTILKTFQGILTVAFDLVVKINQASFKKGVEARNLNPGNLVKFSIRSIN